MSVALAVTPEVQTPADAANFYTALAAQLTRQVGAVAGAPVTAVVPGSQGEFPYNYLDANLHMNPATYAFIAAQAIAAEDVGGAATLELSQFPQTILPLFKQIDFQLSSGDAAKVSAAQNAASQSQTQLVQTYTGTISDQNLADAVTAGWIFSDGTRFNYIVSYIIGGEWAGFKTAPGLTLTEMQNAENLADLLPFAPADAGTLLVALSQYLNAIGPATALLDQQNDGRFRLNAIRRALANPVAGVNGTTLSDGSVVPAYGINNNNIANELANKSQVLTVTAQVRQESASSKSVQFEGQAAIELTEDFITFGASTQVHYSMESAQGAGSSVDVTMTYPGWTLVPVAPMTLTITGGGTTGGKVTGWYAPDILKEAYANWQAGQKGDAPTGYIFTSTNKPSPSIDRFPTGDCNFLSNIVISQFPTITLHYTEGDYASFQEQLATHTEGSISVFGIGIGSASFDTYSMDSHSNQSNSDFTVTLTPPSVTGVAPQLLTAHVLGGVVTSPAV